MFLCVIEWSAEYIIPATQWDLYEPLYRLIRFHFLLLSFTCKRTFKHMILIPFYLKQIEVLDHLYSRKAVLAAYLSPFELSLSVRLRLSLSGTTLRRLSKKVVSLKWGSVSWLVQHFWLPKTNENELIKGTINVLFQLCVWYPLLKSTFALAYLEIFMSWDADSDRIPKEKIESSKTPLFSSFLDLRNVSGIFCLLRSFPGAVETVNCFVFVPCTVFMDNV